MEACSWRRPVAAPRAFARRPPRTAAAGGDRARPEGSALAHAGRHAARIRGLLAPPRRPGPPAARWWATCGLLQATDQCAHGIALDALREPELLARRGRERRRRRAGGDEAVRDDPRATCRLSDRLASFEWDNEINVKACTSASADADEAREAHAPRPAPRRARRAGRPEMPGPVEEENRCRGEGLTRAMPHVGQKGGAVPPQYRPRRDVRLFTEISGDRKTRCTTTRPRLRRPASARSWCREA